jgi:hypothetical protein
MEIVKGLGVRPMARREARIEKRQAVKVTKPVSSVGYVFRLFHVTIIRNRNGHRDRSRLAVKADIVSKTVTF